LWPDASSAEARHSLATALSILRPRLGVGVLEATRDHVALPVGRVALDLDRLLAGDVLGGETRLSLDVAGFLEGFEIPGVHEFALWKDRQQARLLPAIKEALVLQIDRCRRTGASREIEELADRMLFLDELSEDAIRAKMEARAFAGDRLTALKLFEQWKAKLADELGAAPSDLVEGMAVRLRHRGWERTTPTQIPSVPTDQWRGRPFVGRSTEYQALYEAWEETKKGRAAHALVLGDSGIGKTTLVERLTTAAGLEGAVLSRVQCYDIEREIPYATLGTLIQGLIDLPGASGTPPESLAELARVLPAVRRRFPAIPPTLDSHGEIARLRLTQSFQDLVTAIAEEQPLILVSDDLHMTDDASMTVLHSIMREVNACPVMTITIARPGELNRSAQGSRWRDSGLALGLREIEIAPLNDSESRDLLDALVQPGQIAPGSSAVHALVRAAAGFPMVLELLYQDWEEHGDHALALSVEAMTAEFGEVGPPPQLYREALERIVRALDPSTRTVLSVASVLGHRLNEVALYGTADLGIAQIMASMAELVSRRVLRDGGNGLEFVNELVRTAAYLGVPPSLRRLLHTRVADQLMETEKQGTQALGLEIAWHCMRAGRVAEATPYLLRGARHAVLSGAPQSAERALTSALPAIGSAARADACLLLAEVLLEQGRMLESIDVLSSLSPQDAATQCDRITVLTAQAKLNLSRSGTSELPELLSGLTRIVKTSPDARTRALGARALAYLLRTSRWPSRLPELLQVLDDIPTKELDVESLGQLALARALLLYQMRDSEASFHQAVAGIEELKRSGAANLVMAQLHGGLGALSSRAGRYDEAIVHYTNAIALASGIGNDRQVAGLIGNLALCFGRVGRYSDQLEWAARAPLGNGPEFAGFIEVQIAYSRAYALAMAEKFAPVLEVIIRMDARLLGPIPSWILQAWALWKSDLLYLCNQRVEAVTRARASLREESFVLHSNSFAGPYARWVSAIGESEAERLEHHNTLRRMVENLEEYDALDQVEILCAVGRYDSLALGGRLNEELDRRLERLPPAIASQLRSLGMIPLRWKC
jgi:tetratricopeptide (TPR) repeat protein